jgi:hypothetical protein
MLDLSYIIKDMKDTNTKRNTLSTDANEFVIIDDVKNEPTLKAAQDFVGGMVEGISFPNGDYLIVNEEGKLMGLPLNPEATALWRATFDNDNYVTGRKDFVVGPAILIKKQALKQWAS